MPYILKKNKGSLILSISDKTIVDTYESVNLKPYYIKKYFLTNNSISKHSDPDEYRELDNLIDEINLFKERAEVPNKTFIADKKGKSCLRRIPSSGAIYLCYRGKSGDKARTPNTCFLTDDHRSDKSSWVCMNTFDKTISPYTKGTVYLIYPTHPDYKKWSDYMDSEYTRLTGIEIKRFQSEEQIETVSNNIIILADTLAKEIKGFGKKVFSDTIEELVKKGLCKVNNSKTSIYNTKGIWVCRYEEYTDSLDFLKEVFTKLLSTIEEDYLPSIETLLNRNTTFDLLQNGSLFSL